tara:strand:+ start:8609 stop:8896 length:288 start_codon:yes stop_codon:yes gene_type:complete
MPINEKQIKKLNTRINFAPKPPVDIAREEPIDRIIRAYINGFKGTNKASFARPAMDFETKTSPIIMGDESAERPKIQHNIAAVADRKTNKRSGIL